MGHSPWGHKELDTTEATQHTCIHIKSMSDERKTRQIGHHQILEFLCFMSHHRESEKTTHRKREKS